MFLLDDKHQIVDAENILKAMPCANILANSLMDLIRAEYDLSEAKSSVPRYTGQYSDEDYVAKEQQQRNIAANAYFTNLLRISNRLLLT